MLVQEMKRSSVWLNIQGLVFIPPSPLQMQHHKTWLLSPFLAPLFFLMTSIAGPVSICTYVSPCLLSLCCSSGQKLSSSSVLLKSLEPQCPCPCLDLTATWVRPYCWWNTVDEAFGFLEIFSFPFFFNKPSVSNLWRIKYLPRLWLSCNLASYWR